MTGGPTTDWLAIHGLTLPLPPSIQEQYRVDEFGRDWREVLVTSTGTAAGGSVLMGHDHHHQEGQMLRDAKVQGNQRRRHPIRFLVRLLTFFGRALWWWACFEGWGTWNRPATAGGNRHDTRD